ncbi:TonB-linked outer membrane protein, SusC/RagA family [bacterium A37T11]|nr:TonB-linked outer membrane protein, SusC/RagA family [bacterium A37T11]
MNLIAKIILVMRLTSYLLLISLLSVSAHSLAQRVNLERRDAPLQELFNSIRQQTGYALVYDGADIQQLRVSVHLTNASIDEAIAASLKDLPFTYKIIDKNILIKKKEKTIIDRAIDAFAGSPTVGEPGEIQQQLITGRVTDSLGTPLENATIRVKGTSRATFTNKNGQFTLRGLDPTATLQISFLGYTTREVSASGPIGNIILYRTTSELQEAEVTVNTGYQKISKERSTGSYDFIDNQKFNEQVGTNVLDRLHGIANGLLYNPSASGDNLTKISIRGISTINGDATPLIVVDNFPYNGDLSNLNPNNVESVTILKDAAASSIWGARAGNGVIVITTKSGKFGQKMQVMANANVSVVTKPDLFSMKLMTAADFIDVEKMLFKGGAYDGQEQDIYGRPALSPVVELLIQARDNPAMADDANAEIEKMKQYDIRNDLTKYSYQAGVNQQYALQVNGGNSNVAYAFAGGFDKNSDNLDARFQRINLSSLNTFKPTKNLEMTAGFYFTQTDSKTGRQGYGIEGNGYAPAPIYTRLVDDQGNPLPLYRYRKPYIDTLGQGKLLDWSYYPLEDYKHSYGDNSQLDITLNTGLSYHITDAIKVSFNYQYEKQKGTNATINDQQSFYTRDLINSFTQIPADGSDLIYPVPKGDIEYMSNPTISSNQVRGQVDVNQTWGDHELVALAGGEIRSARSDQYSSSIYGFDPNSSTSANVDYYNGYPNIISGSYSYIDNQQGKYNQLNRFVSVFANAAYMYQSKYTLSGSLRRDASNIFGATTNNKWKPLWSAGLGWDIAKEAFYHIDLLPYLKLRGSYGYSGNMSASIIGVTTIRYPGVDYYSHQPFSLYASYNNPDLRWENVANTNIGIDFRSTRNVISGSVEYYRKKTSDLYGPVQTDYTTIPVFQLTKNVASTLGNGVDIQLNTKNVDQEIKWNTNVNFTWYKDKVLKYNANYSSASTLVGDSRISPGGNNAVYGIYSYPWAGLNHETGQPQGYLSGQVSTDYLDIFQAPSSTVTYNGPATPTYFGNMGNTIAWHELSLAVNISYRFGYYFIKPSIYYSSLIQGTGHADFEKRWRKPGDELKTNVPALIYPFDGSSDEFYNSASILVDKADNIRIDYLRFNYALNKLWIKKAGMNTLNLYFNMANVGPIWTANKDHIDPDNQTIKPSKNIYFGISASF